MIKIALPNKGMLFEPTLELLNSCGYKAKKSWRSLSSIDKENNIEFFFLRPADIPMFVGKGIIDVGVTGIDFVAERGTLPTKIVDLDYGASKLCAAAPKGQYKDIMELKGKIIATSFPNTTREFFKAPDMEIVELEGAVEISVALGIADAVVDIVETGGTLKQAGLEILGDPISFSNAAVFCHPGQETKPEILRLKRRIEGNLLAKQYVMVEYDAPRSKENEVCEITPGIESPSVIPLKDNSWIAVKAMVKKEEAHSAMDKLADLGCRGIVMTAIETVRNS